MTKQINKRFWESKMFDNLCEEFNLSDKGEESLRNAFRKIELSTYDRVIEVLEGKKKEYMWSNGECTICGHNSYYDEGTEHRCEVANDILDSAIEQINNLKQ